MTTTDVTGAPEEPGTLEPEVALERVADACHRPALDLWDLLDERAGTTVAAAVREALAKHAAVVDRVGLFGKVPGEPEERAQCLRSYRHDVADEVLTQLELALEHYRPTLMMAREMGAAFDVAWKASRTLPVKAEVRWGSGALETLPIDGFGRRVKKLLARGFSAARKPGGTRQAALRAVALHHLEARVAPILADAGSDAVEAWARWIVALEKCCADWAGEVLPVLTNPGVAATRSDESEESEDAADTGEDANLRTVAGWERVAAGARVLAENVTALLETAPHQAARERAKARLSLAEMELSSDLRVVGCFVYSPPGGAVEGPRLITLDALTQKFGEWDAQAAARFEMYRSYLEILLGSAAVLDRLEDAVRSAVLDPQADLGGSLVDLEGLANEARSQAPGTVTEEALADLRGRAEAAASRAIERFPEASTVGVAFEAIVSDTVDALQAIVRGSPARLVLHRLHEASAGTLRTDETRLVPFQDRARQSLDAMRIERIRSSVLELAVGLVPIRASLVELPDVLGFAFQTAGSELAVTAPEKGAQEEAEGRPEERAIRLTVEALERSAGVVQGVPERVAIVLERARSQIDGEMARGAEALLERLGAGRMQSQLLRARSSVFELWLRLVHRVGPTLRRVSRNVRFLYLRARRAVRRVQRAIVGMVSEGSASDTRAARTIRAFATADSGPGHVPLVYQRLFSMGSVVDPTFLVGRAAELADVLKRWRRWLKEDEVPLVVRGYPGVGVTSFLNGSVSLLEENGATVARVDVPERLLEEAPLAALIAETLGAGTADTFADLAQHLLTAPKDAIPDVVILDTIEHLYLRVAGGTDLLERLLTLMSETEPRIFWLAGVGQPAWQLLSMVEPTAVAQVDGLHLPPLTVERLRETILQRHRRSGLRMRFLEPQEGRALLRRRARRLRGTEGHQRLLERDFFDQLHRVSLGNLTLAMFHWLLAADFETREGEVLLHPLVRPDLSVLDSLANTQNFTLKALLEHRTLTLDEHCQVFRVGRHESYQIFESLQNRRLVEEMTPHPTQAADGSELERTSRYRIRPLLVGAVTTHLRKLNIVH